MLKFLNKFGNVMKTLQNGSYISTYFISYSLVNIKPHQIELIDELKI